MRGFSQAAAYLLFSFITDSWEVKVTDGFVIRPSTRLNYARASSSTYLHESLPHVNVNGNKGSDVVELGFEPHETSPVHEPISKTNFDNYQAEHAESIGENRKKYWTNKATELLDWFSFPFQEYSADSAISGSFEDGDVTFFAGAKLNACYNAVDRHVEKGNGDNVAIIHEGDEPDDVTTFTYKELQRRVSQIANAMKEAGIRKGDVVTIYMPMIPEVAMVMLACARIGAVHSVVFAGFSSDALADRIAASKSKWVFTADEGLRGTKKIPLKQITDEAIAKERCESIVQNVFVWERTGKDLEEAGYWSEGRDIKMDGLVAKQRPYCPCEAMDAEDNLFILYTSGSTGQPKGLVHTTGGYSLYAAYTTKTTFGLKSGDIYACVADAGWITGHTYICYGPLINGATTFMFESTPFYPDVGRYWDCIQRHSINIFYTAPTAIRSLMKFGDAPPNRYDLSSLRVLGSVGEPINPEAWRWYYEVVGKKKCTVVDTYWQTETGGHIVTNIPGSIPMKAGSCTLPFYGIDLAVLDPTTGKEIEGNEVEGILAIKQPWPGMARTCLGDHDRYLNVYMKPYPGYYFAGDSVERDEDGYHWITGRVDDVINVSGHRIGTAEVESALVSHPAVAQAAVVGFPHSIKGQAISCFTTLTEGYEASKELTTELRATVRKQIGPFASPDLIVPTPSLPMTRSGKIMRRVLRKITAGEADSLGDTSTLADPSVVDDLIELVEKQMKL